MGGVIGGVKVPQEWDQFFVDAEFPFVNWLAEGEELSYPFERVSIMGEEGDG